MRVPNQSEWKPLKFEGAVLEDGGGLEGLIGIEELVDYEEIGKNKPKTQKDIAKPSKKRKAPAVDTEEKYEKKPIKKAKTIIDTKPKTTTIFGFTIEENAQPEIPDKNESDTKNGKSLNVLVSNKPQKKVVKPKRIEIGMTKELEIDEENDSKQETKKTLKVEDLVAWNGLGLPVEVMQALAEQGFERPTPIQALTLAPAILGRRDILGAAETGSGKTLAFGLPIINGIVEMKKNAAKAKSDKAITDLFVHLGLIKVPEPEIKGDEISVSSSSEDEDESCWSESESSSSKYTSDEDEKVSIQKSELKPLYALILTPTRELAVQIKNHLIAAAKHTDINVAVVVGGMASVKQERILSKGPEIVVATPGRLWEMISAGNRHLSQIDSISYLAIDETDRMMERSHFMELQNLLEKINLHPEKVKARQNFVFSATLTLVHDLPKHLKIKKKGKSKKILKQTSEQKINSLIEILGITNPKIVDVTQKKNTAETLTECRICCPFEHKDYYLYYFLQRHPGRTIVFCNSIGCVKRLVELFGLLGCDPVTLHGSMQQKQRLKNLERFRDDERAVLVATDVAARGLDIPDVQHVIHYQVPRTSENYIHRSGRTARSQKEGIAVLIMEPAEMSVYTRLCKTLGRTQDLPLFPIIDSYLASVKPRVNLARELDTLQLHSRRSQAHNGWIEKAAEEMDIIIDQDDDEDNELAQQTAKQKRLILSKKKQLTAMLSKPLFPKGFSCKFPTSSGQLDIPLVQGDQSTENAVEVMKKAIENYKRTRVRVNKNVNNESNNAVPKNVKDPKGKAK